MHRLRALTSAHLAEAAVLLGLGLLAALVVGQWLGTARRLAAGTDNTAVCAANLRSLGLATEQYAQDSDEILPPMQTPQAFRTAVMPFVKDASAFTCPDTGLPYTINAAVSQKSIPSLGNNTDTVEIARDPQPHEDGLIAVGFLDGHVERGGVEYGDPTAIITSREKALTLAVTQYTQDNDEAYPPDAHAAGIPSGGLPLRSPASASSTLPPARRSPRTPPSAASALVPFPTRPTRSFCKTPALTLTASPPSPMQTDTWNAAASPTAIRTPSS